MKTNVLKSAVLFVALSFAFTACQKDSLVMEMETKKIKTEELIPNDDKNKRIDIKKIPIDKDDRYRPDQPIVVNEIQTPTVTPSNNESNYTSLKKVKQYR